MNDYYNFNARLAEFYQAPVVDIFGAMITKISGFNNYAPPDVVLASFCFGVWKIGSNEAQAGWLRMNLMIPSQEIRKMVGDNGLLLTPEVVHIKARILEEEAGIKEAHYVEWVGQVFDEAILDEIHQKVHERSTLDLPPAPLTVHDQYRNLYSTITLQSWAYFCPASEPNLKHADGLFTLDVETEEAEKVRTGYEPNIPAPAQFAAYYFLLENDALVRDAILQAIFDQYPQWQEDYGGDYEYMPDIAHPMQLKSLLGMRSVTIMHEEKHGVAYMYFNMDPEWDIEHGIAAVVHKDRVIAVGIHDLMYKVAEEDMQKD